MHKFMLSPYYVFFLLRIYDMLKHTEIGSLMQHEGTSAFQYSLDHLS